MLVYLSSAPECYILILELMKKQAESRLEMVRESGTVCISLCVEVYNQDRITFHLRVLNYYTSILPSKIVALHPCDLKNHLSALEMAAAVYWQNYLQSKLAAAKQASSTRAVCHFPFGSL